MCEAVSAGGPPPECAVRATRAAARRSLYAARRGAYATLRVETGMGARRYPAPPVLFFRRGVLRVRAA
jgi:hypothetical protein